MSRKPTTIAKKIGSGFAVVLLLVLLLTTIYEFALLSATGRFSNLIEQDLSIALHASAAKISLIQCRQNEKLLLYADDALLTKEANNQIASFQDEMSTIEALAKKGDKGSLVEAARQLGTLADNYQKGFAAMLATPIGNERMLSALSLRKSAQALEPLLDKLLEEAKAEAGRQTMLTKEFSTLLGRIALALGALALICGGLFAYFIGRGVARSLVTVSLSLNEGADQVAAAAGEVSSASQSLAEGASEQAAAVEQTSASLEEVGAMIKKDADNARQADLLMKEANGVIQTADQSMKKLTASMEEISAASRETQKIVKTIDEIAFQTNLLALNAAVEAARAGEAGAGFAVVADEVRNLAMRAAEAARNTSTLIEGTMQKVQTGSELVSETGDSFYEASQSTARIGTIIAEMAGSATEQARSIEQVTKAIHEIDQVTQDNAAAAEESASASEELSAQSEILKGSVGELLRLAGGGGETAKIRKGPGQRSTPALRPPSLPTPTKTRNSQAALPPRTNPKEKAGASARKDNPNEIIPMDDEDFADF